jgi:hypothetical protein
MKIRVMDQCDELLGGYRKWDIDMEGEIWVKLW